MHTSSKILSEIIINSKYSRVKSDGSKETWNQIVDRNIEMHLSKFHNLIKGNGYIKDVILSAFDYVREKYVLPSMRSLQFAGQAIEAENARIYNCSYINITHPKDFSEIIYLSLCGTGVGYNISKNSVYKLPRIFRSNQTKKFVIQDHIKGWSLAVDQLIHHHLCAYDKPIFDYSLIRPKGSILKTSGGIAPGSDKLRWSLEKIDELLSNKKEGERLEPIDVHDIICYLSEAVVSGGIRRSALISLFDYDDPKMMESKKIGFHDDNSQRERANNSMILNRGRFSEKYKFDQIFSTIIENGTGEPGFFWTNDDEIGCNPCAEISLNSYQFCNLTEINFAAANSQNDLMEFIKAATIIGTLQAAYSDFDFLRPVWKQVTTNGALLGVSLTGICAHPNKFDLRRAAKLAVEVNSFVSGFLGIKKAHRITTIKPAGTTSCVLGTSSGIHAYYDDYYIRRLRINKDEPIFAVLKQELPELLEDSVRENEKNLSILSLPIKSPDNCITTFSESAIDVLERIKKYFSEWILPGHREGENTNNISSTVNVRTSEIDEVRDWMWENRLFYNAISLFPHPDNFGTNDHPYPQAPFESISKEKYELMEMNVKEIDFSKLKNYSISNDVTIDESACAGGSCEVR